MTEATNSEMAMFRATIALAWADHSLSDEEQHRLEVYMDNNKSLSVEQRDQLKKEVHQPIKMDEVWSDVTEVRDRVHVINLADAIFWEDGELCHSEKEVYEKIKEAHMATIDVDAIREDITAYRKELLVNREQFKQELHEMRGPFGRMMHYLETMVDKAIS